jgi:sulfite dehydrogenase (quinone) subunit SoeC
VHPAKSVIFFTTASGAGYGLMIWLGIAKLLNLLPLEPLFACLSFGLAFVLIIGGLLASTFHLGHPERAWRAMSQWQSSWLSREGLAAVLSFAPMGLLALYWLWPEQALLANISGAMAWGTIIMAVLTVSFTAMIYASLKTIPAWNSKMTVIVYLVLSLMSGAMLMALLTSLWGYGGAGLFATIALVFVLLGLGVKLLYWARLASKKAISTAGSATGLADFGAVTLVESPHSTDNYLLEEMGFKIARKHAAKLRRIAILLGFLAPILLFSLAIMQENSSLQTGLLFAGVVLGGIGLVVERWLFFAEAKHVVTLYYGEHAI